MIFERVFIEFIELMADIKDLGDIELLEKTKKRETNRSEYLY